MRFFFKSKKLGYYIQVFMLYDQNIYFFILVFLLSFVLVQPERATDTISDHPDGVLIYLYPSGSVLSLVSRQIFLHLKNQL